jgi:hypothetical protein
MGFNDTNKSITAFKNLLGKSMTDASKALGNEAEGIFFNVPGSAVWLSPIDPTPATAVSQLVATAVTADLIPDPTSNTHGFFTAYPTLITSGANALVVGTSYIAITTSVVGGNTYNAGQPFVAASTNLTSGTVKQRVLNLIPPSYGNGYEAKPFDNTAAAISVGDARNWIYQYNSGVFFQQDLGYPTPATINVYAYVGNTLVNGSSGKTQWQNSVKSVIATPPVTPAIGDRYLIAPAATGVWTGFDNNIAEWTGTAWKFTSPTQGFALKVDNDDNTIYNYNGTYPGGTWVAEPLGSVRAAFATGTNSYTATVTPPIDEYELNMIMLLTFSNSNTNAATLNVNGLGVTPLKKDNGAGTLINLNPTDLKPGIVYMVLYDGTQFEVFTGGGGGIGLAPDGDYIDGLFTDFTPATPVGTAVDRFNEILKALAPPPAPPLTDWSGVKGGLNVTGNLSFDSTHPVPTATYVGADTATTSPISIDGTWTVAGKRLGISADPTHGGGDISGILNYQVAAHVSTPTPAYVAGSFGDAEKGVIKLYVNGTEIVSARVDLTSTINAIDTTASGTTSGFSVSAQSPSHFPQGDALKLFQNRTGTWTVKANSSNIVQGYNYIVATHEVSPTTTHTLARFEFVLDDNTSATSYSGQTLHNLAMTGSKKISGIDYNTGGTVQYDVSIFNAYKNTYSADADAVSFNGNSNTYGLLLSAPYEALPISGGNTQLVRNIAGKLSTITTAGIRIINGPISLTTTVKRTVQGTTTSAPDSISHLLLDNIAASSTLVLENFDDETYRLKSGVAYDLVADVAANGWDSTQSLKDGSAGHIDGLQIIDGLLIYPGANVAYPANFTTANITNGSVFNDGGTGGTARNYTSLSGSRTYYRYFRQVSPTTANFIMNIAGTNGTFVDTETTLTGNNIHVEIKGPSETGWMDAFKDFATGQFADGNGARNGAGGTGRAFGTPWGLTIGTKNTANTGGYMVIRITVGATFTGSIDNISWLFN